MQHTFSLAEWVQAVGGVVVGGYTIDRGAPVVIDYSAVTDEIMFTLESSPHLLRDGRSWEARHGEPERQHRRDSNLVHENIALGH